MDHLLRKIIHIDMDCFYAAIEIRDDPTLVDKPVAVGGAADERGVLCTCNYIARQFGVRSAMPTAYALRLCPELIILPVNMHKYREAAYVIRSIFSEYTSIIEPLSLDEAYLDVSNSEHHQGSATLIANEIRQKIAEQTKITASAGVAPNKFLAKIASGWNKPNGTFVIRPHDIEPFIKKLPVQKIFGVGKVTARRLHDLSIKTCEDLQKLSSLELTRLFGKLGNQLYQQSRGIDNRQIESNRIRKSLSIERTFKKDIYITEDFSIILKTLYHDLIKRIEESASNLKIKNQYIKIKFSNFKLTTLEIRSQKASLGEYENLLYQVAKREPVPIRLLGLGVHFQTDTVFQEFMQQSLF